MMGLKRFFRLGKMAVIRGGDDTVGQKQKKWGFRKKRLGCPENEKGARGLSTKQKASVEHELKHGEMRRGNIRVSRKERGGARGVPMRRVGRAWTKMVSVALRKAVALGEGCRVGGCCWCKRRGERGGWG